MDKRKFTISNRNKKRLFWAVASVVVFVTMCLCIFTVPNRKNYSHI